MTEEMRLRAVVFFKSYFKVSDEDMELYSETIDCMVKFTQREFLDSVYKLIDNFDEGEINKKRKRSK